MRDNTMFCGFNPAVSPAALKTMRSTIRDLGIRHRTQMSLADIARQINPLLRGWIELLYAVAHELFRAGAAVGNYGAFQDNIVYGAVRRSTMDRLDLIDAANSQRFPVELLTSCHISRDKAP